VQHKNYRLRATARKKGGGGAATTVRSNNELELKTAVIIKEVPGALTLSPIMTSIAGQITQSSLAPGAWTTTRSRPPRATSWVVTSEAAMMFGVEGKRRMKINKLIIIIIILLKVAVSHHKKTLI
jgi:hypothetical protein